MLTKLHPKVQVHLRYNAPHKNLKIETQIRLVSTHLRLIVQEQRQDQSGTRHILRVFRVADCSDYFQWRSLCES